MQQCSSQARPLQSHGPALQDSSVSMFPGKNIRVGYGPPPKIFPTSQGSNSHSQFLLQKWILPLTLEVKLEVGLPGLSGSVWGPDGPAQKDIHGGPSSMLSSMKWPQWGLRLVEPGEGPGMS